MRCGVEFAAAIPSYGLDLFRVKGVKEESNEKGIRKHLCPLLLYDDKLPSQLAYYIESIGTSAPV